MPPIRMPFQMPSFDTMSPMQTQRREMLTTPTITAPATYGAPITPPGVSKPPGLLTRIGRSIQDRLAPPPPAELASLLDADSIKAARRNSILQLGSSLLQNSGWSNTPVTLGQALGQGLQDASQGYQQQIGQLANQAVQRQNALYLGEQRMAIADERGANAAAKNLELKRVTDLMTKRPALYQGVFANWAGKTREQQQQTLFDAYGTAIANNDKETADAIKGMIASGNVIAAAPKPANMRTVTTEEGVFAFDPATGRRGERLGDRTRPAERTIINSGEPSTFERGVITRDAATIKKEVGDFRRQYDLARPVLNLINKPDKDLTGVDNIAALYQFIRTMDPNAVKEGELQLAKSSDPYVERLRNIVSKGVRGTQISAPTMRLMLDVVRESVMSKQGTVRNNIGGAVSRISAIDPSYIQPADTALGGYTPATPNRGRVGVPTGTAASTGLFNTSPRPAPASLGGTPLPPPPAGLPVFQRKRP